MINGWISSKRKRELREEKNIEIGAGAVVNKEVPEYEIWAGVPAKKIGERK